MSVAALDKRHMGPLALFGFIWDHPLNRGGRLAALGRFVRWQVASRLMRTKISLPFVNGSVLLVRNGMTGATGNYYCGLHEPDDMGFVLHALRPGELFIDVGANIGSYTVLAASLGANVISVEPIPDTFAHLRQNIFVNYLDGLVHAHCIGLSDKAGTLYFSTDQDTMNHVLRTGEKEDGCVEVHVTTLDDICDGHPSVIKIDVEGHELTVLAGARRTLSSGSLLAVIVEINGNSEKYGVSADSILSLLGDCGFRPYGYDAVSRTITEAVPGNGNTIFLRDLQAVERRIKAAPRSSLVNGSI
jgi:FkbM family methyltransferase